MTCYHGVFCTTGSRASPSLAHLHRTIMMVVVHTVSAALPFIAVDLLTFVTSSNICYSQPVAVLFDYTPATDDAHERPGLVNISITTFLGVSRALSTFHTVARRVVLMQYTSTRGCIVAYVCCMYNNIMMALLLPFPPPSVRETSRETWVTLGGMGSTSQPYRSEQAPVQPGSQPCTDLSIVKGQVTVGQRLQTVCKCLHDSPLSPVTITLNMLRIVFVGSASPCLQCQEIPVCLKCWTYCLPESSIRIQTNQEQSIG